MNQTTKILDFFQLKKNLKKDFSEFSKHKVALLGDSSTQLLAQTMRGYGYEVGLNLDIYEADYNQIEQEVFDTSSGLYSFNPEFIILFNSTQKCLTRFYSSSEQQKKDFASGYVTKLNELIDNIKEHLPSKIIYCNFIEVNDRVFGNYGNKVDSSFIFQIRKLNYELMLLATAQRNLFINDISTLNNQVGFKFAFDSKIYISADFVFSLDFTTSVAKNVVDIILPIIGRMKKCLILDLDNTIWGGIIGDDGIENIQIGDLGIGKAFTQLQAWAKQLKQRGIILAVCSKNTESLAKEPFEKHPDMVLKLDDISVFVANWETKVDNIRYIQSVLNIGYDSMVFIDDNPFEREFIRREIPGIEVPELPEDTSEYVGFLQMLNLFETASFSEEDIERTRQYQEEAKRVVLKQSFNNESDYLKSLEMISYVKAFDNFSTPRVAQLTQRSNQFNLRTIRYTEEDIQRIIFSPDYITLSFNLKDKFGDHGLIAALILNNRSISLFIDTWVMSCRVLKRGMEKFIINEIVKVAKSKKINQIVGEYLPTPKNAIVKDLYPSLGFYLENQQWVLDIISFTPHEIYIDAKYQ
jgi:FkbH-like protein